MADRPDTRTAHLQTILQLEARKGYNDRTVIGGLDQFLAVLAAQDNRIPLPHPSYSALAPEQRGEWATRLLAWLAHPRAATEPSVPPDPTPAPGARRVTRPQPLGAAAEKKPSPATRKATPTAAPKPPTAAAARPQRVSSATLTTPLERLTGVRRELAAGLAKLGVSTVRDALFFFPRRHIDFSQRKSIAELVPDLEQTVIGFVWSSREIILGRRMRGAEVIVGDESGNVRAVWFNQPYLAKTFKAQAQVVLSGKVHVFRGQLAFESPEYDILDTAPDGEPTNTGRLVPVYPLTAGLSGRTVRRLVRHVVERFADQVPEPLPDALRAKHNFMPLTPALRAAHYPDDWEQYDAARVRLAFDELLTMQLGALTKRREWQRAEGIPLPADPTVLAGFKASLPFRLTPAQERVQGEILADLALAVPMSRLLQGDVGSGKTVVATAMLLLAVAAGYQGAIMAPTEILTEQHYRSLSALFGVQEVEALEVLPLPYLSRMGRPLRLGLLTGSVPARERLRLLAELAEGELDIVVGTHALLQEDVRFHHLAAAVIDEQHRFGVAQRALLRRKGDNPHVLVMTATPIPRTLALTLYGDLESSVLDEMPPGRRPIETQVLNAANRADAYRFVREQVAAGRQIYIICPLIEESATVEAKAATAEYERLSTQVFPDLRVGLLHGRLPTKEKDRVMGKFRAGELDILVSTSVIEVGIDVANATVMVIEGADRFGLSQLHQLRGRVGRGSHQSYCLLLSESVSPEAQERLAIMARVSSGFELAEEDLRLRGPGEFFGTRQTGLPDLRMARLDDWQLLETARAEARTLLAADPDLAQEQHQLLREAVDRLQPLGHTDLS